MNDKLYRSISQKPININNYILPVVNLSSHWLDLSVLKYGLHQWFTDKNEHIKQNLAVEYQS